MLLGGTLKTKWIFRARMLLFIVPNKLFKVFELNSFERSDVLVNKKKVNLLVMQSTMLTEYMLNCIYIYIHIAIVDQ